jgi:hypothetical protein
LRGLASFGRGSTADAQERLNLLVCAEQNALFTPEGAMTKPLLLISELAAPPGQHHSLRAASLTAQPVRSGQLGIAINHDGMLCVLHR